jgi:hypothetical protein
MAGTDFNLGIRNTFYQLFFDQYIAAGGAGAPTYQNTLGYLSSDGITGYLYWDLWENNVAASGAIIIEGTDNIAPPAGSHATFWSPVGYYAEVANGTTGTTLARAQGAVTLTQNTLTRLHVLDFYKFMRARVSSNASSASLSAAMYGVPN